MTGCLGRKKKDKEGRSDGRKRKPGWAEIVLFFSGTSDPRILSTVNYEVKSVRIKFSFEVTEELQPVCLLDYDALAFVGLARRISPIHITECNGVARN
jgi:hypothetical protein